MYCNIIILSVTEAHHHNNNTGSPAAVPSHFSVLQPIGTSLSYFTVIHEMYLFTFMVLYSDLITVKSTTFKYNSV